MYVDVAVRYEDMTVNFTIRGLVFSQNGILNKVMKSR